MERDGFLPEGVNLFPRARRMAEFVARQFMHLQHEGLSDHGSRGGGPALDRALYDQPELPFHYVDPTGSGWPVIERPDAAQLDRTAVNRWDSMGDYTERSE